MSIKISYFYQEVKIKATAKYGSLQRGAARGVAGAGDNGGCFSFHQAAED
jgi:hypothetical protein